MDNEKLKSMPEKTVYDSVFWTELNKLSRYIAPLVNEMFGEHFTQDAKVTFLSNKETVELPDGTIARREVDALVQLSEEQDGLIEKEYHFECEVRGRKSVAIRIAQYDAGYAFKNAEATETGAVMMIPHSAVIFLRAESTALNKLTIRIKYPGGEAAYDVPVIRIRDYTINELFEKKLLLLVPFYVFKFHENEFKKMDMDAQELENLNAVIKELNEKLNELVAKGELEPYQKTNLILYMTRVLRKVSENYENMQKGVERIMGGYIIKTELDIAREEGIEEGLEKGLEKGLKKGHEEGMNTLAKAIEDLRAGVSYEELCEKYGAKAADLAKAFK